MAQAATCLAAYQTAWYALVELGRIRAGDKILIHAAAGGVGLAAVQVAKRFGAEIFATAGSEEKRDYLRRLGVQHLMDSRSLEFSGQILEATAGMGVDLVLNSISGDAIAKSIAVLAHGGRFLEIGKRDIYANSTLELFPFRKNLSYYAIDMLGLSDARPDVVARVTQAVVECLASGELPPLPVVEFPASQAADAFRYMVQSRQIGKIAVTFAEDEVRAEIPEDRLIRPDATYLITGGLSGIGLECARWLAGRGARNLVLVSRRVPTEEETRKIEALRAGGVNVIATIENVRDLNSMRRVIEAIDRDLPPLAGVIHSAGIARDGILERLEWEHFEDVFAPKLSGGWNLHTLLHGRDLDFCVLFSSVASWLGSAGQGNYAAANAFLDALGELRAGLDLPVLTLNWGPWTSIGMLERHRLRPAPIFGEEGIRPERGIACLGALLARDCSHATVMSSQWSVWPQAAPALASKPLFTCMRPEMSGGGEGSSEASSPGLAGRLAALPEAAGMDLVRERVVREVIAVLRCSRDRVDVHVDLRQLGLDSLMAVELSARLELACGCSVPVMNLLKEPTLEELSAAIYQDATASSPASSSSPAAQPRRSAQDWTTSVLVCSQDQPSLLRPEAWGLQEGDHGPALFCLGGLYEWAFVVQQLGDRQRAVSVVPTVLETIQRPAIEDFAAAAQKVIRECQPRGPYHLAGWSVWGLVAMEVAQQLAASADEVGTVVLVDTFLPFRSRKLTGLRRAAAWAHYEQRHFAYHFQKLREQKAEFSADYIKQRLDSLVRYRVRPMVQSFAKDKPVDRVTTGKDLAEIILAASMNYRARPYAGRVVLCSAEDRHEDTPEVYFKQWKHILTGDVECLTLDGNHVTMFDPENVQPLIETLRVRLNHAELK